MRCVRIMCFCAALLFFISPLGAETIYYYRDSKGVLHFTDLPSSVRYKPFMTFGTKSDYDRSRILELVKKYSRVHQMDARLVQAVLEVESNYQNRCKSKAGAEGLMQIMPETQKDLGLQAPYEPEANIEAGIRYLKQLTQRFPTLKTALAAYNAGPSRVEQYKGLPPFPETVQYVQRVLKIYDKLKMQN